MEKVSLEVGAHIRRREELKGLRWAAPAGLVARILGPSGEQKLDLKAVEC